MWPGAAVFANVGGYTLLVFTQDPVSRWEVRLKAKAALGGDGDLVAGGSADTFAAAKGAALFKAMTRVSK